MYVLPYPIRSSSRNGVVGVKAPETAHFRRFWPPRAVLPRWWPPLSGVLKIMLSMELEQICAQAEGRSTFMFRCPAHGETKFFTATAKCVCCTARLMLRANPDRYDLHAVENGADRRVPRSDENRAKARRARVWRYEGVCVTHGVVDFHVGTGKCLTCCNAVGVPRASAAKGATPRSMARNAGARVFRATCSIHGEVDHYTATGKCLLCFTTGGALRTNGPIAPRVYSPRADARREGRKTYVAICGHHGEAEHSVHRGECLKCFTTAGLWRPAMFN